MVLYDKQYEAFTFLFYCNNMKKAEKNSRILFTQSVPFVLLYFSFPHFLKNYSYLFSSDSDSILFSFLFLHLLFMSLNFFQFFFFTLFLFLSLSPLLFHIFSHFSAHCSFLLLFFFTFHCFARSNHYFHIFSLISSLFLFFPSLSSLFICLSLSLFLSLNPLSFHMFSLFSVHCFFIL
ncbi:unnamed protein product [Acanthosepion pharaonis]|uniref:Uncharacterized protein n=1 Tax=Acanthosepion pharaonis TaxID=158019 RepID=A0A812B9A8_ACAPH|nr:unnamed protein product [Sepia pharaonis]